MPHIAIPLMADVIVVLRIQPGEIVMEAAIVSPRLAARGPRLKTRGWLQRFEDEPG